MSTRERTCPEQISFGIRQCALLAALHVLNGCAPTRCEAALSATINAKRSAGCTACDRRAYHGLDPSRAILLKQPAPGLGRGPKNCCCRPVATHR